MIYRDLPPTIPIISEKLKFTTTYTLINYFIILLSNTEEKSY